MKRLLIAGLALALTPFAALAQDYPSRPVTIVVPSTAGAVQDIVARLVGDRLSARLGQQFVIENKPGAATNIGTAFVANAAPDGYTILLSTTGIASYPDMFKSLPYDPIADFANIAAVASGPAVLFAAAEHPANDMKEMIELSKSEPNGIDYATSGIGVIHHQAIEMIKSKTGANFRMIPFNGGAPVVTAVTGRQVGFASLSLAGIRAQLDAGRIKALGIMQLERSPLAPEVPTLTELGLPEVDASIQFHLAAPEGTPAEIVSTLETAVREILADPGVVEPFSNVGLEATFLSGAETTEAMKLWADTWRPIIEEAGISLE